MRFKNSVIHDPSPMLVALKTKLVNGPFSRCLFFFKEISSFDSIQE
jgi:hypothetical protein